MLRPAGTLQAILTIPMHKRTLEQNFGWCFGPSMPSELVIFTIDCVCCRAEIVGEKTFGKGVVQYYFPMTDGSGIKLTIAKYLTPGSFDITQSGGLHPDHVCSDFPHGDRVTPENDTCIQDALRLIGQSS